jgi:hypothetical protein
MRQPPRRIIVTGSTPTTGRGTSTLAVAPLHWQWPLYTSSGTLTTDRGTLTTGSGTLTAGSGTLTAQENSKEKERSLQGVATAEEDETAA